MLVKLNNKAPKTLSKGVQWSSNFLVSVDALKDLQVEMVSVKNFNNSTKD